jgi:hypothetical protein
MGLIRKQFKDALPKHMRTCQVYCDGFRRLQGTSNREDNLIAQLMGGRSLLLGENRKRVLGMEATCPQCGHVTLGTFRVRL